MIDVRLHDTTRATWLEVTLAGDIDLTNAAHLGHELLQVVERAQPVPVVIDVGAVTYIDSQGLRVLAETAVARGTTGQSITLVAPEGCFAASVLRFTPLPNTMIVAEPPHD